MSPLCPPLPSAASSLGVLSSLGLGHRSFWGDLARGWKPSPGREIMSKGNKGASSREARGL